jgi:hypothetical protein
MSIKLSDAKPENPKGLEPNQDVVRWNDCPACKGRGWFLINPFATGGYNFVGGLSNICQCQVCLKAHEHWKTTGELPKVEM